MLINQACKAAGITKKATIYYMEQGLISPIAMGNGYRDFSDDDVKTLKKIGVLRELGLSICEIKDVFLDRTGETLQRVCVKKELEIDRGADEKRLLERLVSGEGYHDIAGDIEAIRAKQTITDRLLKAFPGYYGRFVCLHFARFLNEPIASREQEQAFEEIMDYLDGIHDLGMSRELEDYLKEYTSRFTTQNIKDVMGSVKKSIENPDDFINQNKEMLEEYLAFKQSEEFKNSPAYEMQEKLKEFNSSSGYNDVFIPAMKRLSPSYAEYYRQLEAANDKLLDRFPEILKLGK